MHPNTVRATLFAVALSVPSLHAVSAQDARVTQRPRPTIFGEPGLSLLWSGSADRAVLGVTLAAAARGDTAGIRIESVDADGPAAKAGLKAGDVITEINGVNLRVSADDADDIAMVGVTQRRLQRTMAKAKPGDEVDLRVRSGGSARSVKVVTVSAADLDGSRARTATIRRSGDNDERGAVGVSIGGTANPRDTLGLFVSSVISGGPADKAGIIEGERIAAVNGVDVRVAKEDVEDMTASSARMNRFIREVQKATPGSAITLRVFGNGRYREVSMKTVKTSELPASGGFQVMGGDGGVRIIRRSGGELEFDRGALERTMEQFRGRMQDMGREMRLDLRELPRIEGMSPVRVQALPRRALTHM